MVGEEGVCNIALVVMVLRVGLPLFRVQDVSAVVALKMLQAPIVNLTK